MNVFVVTQQDAFYLCEFFRRLFARVRGAPYTIGGVSILKPFNDNAAGLGRRMLDFWGPRLFVRMAFLYALRTVLGRTVSGLCRRENVRLAVSRDVNSRAFVDDMKTRRIDVVLSAASPQIFRAPLIEAAGRGCLNVHSALLPENRGMMPVFWAMAKGESVTGVTVHFIDRRLDAGDIVAQRRVPIDSPCLHDMILATKRVGADMVDDVLRRMSSGPYSSTPIHGGGYYQSFPTRADVQAFRRRGLRLI